MRLPEVVARALAEAHERTQLKEAQAHEHEIQEDLIEANREKDNFLALLSHELRNPLVPMIINAELIANDVKDPATYERAQAIHRQAQHMSKLLDDLLDVTRITQGKITLKKECVDMKTIIDDAIDMVRPLALERGHAIREDTASFPLEVDPVRLEQIVVNLLNNAVKYTDRGGQIDIMARHEGNDAIIMVKDNGIGISADLLPHVFDMFVRGDQSIARTSSGLGVGLTLVKKLAELHGGSVKVESEGFRKGSEFTVTIPLNVGNIGTHEQSKKTEVSSVRAERSNLVAQKGESLSSRGKHKNVLVVDDNRDLSDALGTVLRASGHTVRVVYDGAEAIRVAGEMRPQVILLDIGLPVMDGLAVARTLREKFGYTMELVALSGYGQEQDKQKAYDAGFDRYIVKPIGVKELQAAV